MGSQRVGNDYACAHKRNRNWLTSHLTHRERSGICGMMEGLCWWPEPSDLPLSGAGFLSGNVDNHPYSMVGWRLRWKALSGKAHWISDASGGGEWVPRLATNWASQKPAGDLRRPFEKITAPALISPGTTSSPAIRLPYQRFHTPDSASLALFRLLWNKCPGPPPPYSLFKVQSLLQRRYTDD